LRPEDILGGTRCSNCGSDQHKSWECPDAPNVTASIVCTACGGAGHIARDCKNPRPGFQYDGGAGMDDEYSALMAELGVTPEPGTYDPGMAAAMGGVPKFSLQRQQQQQERKFTLPSGAPIVRVNLAKQQPTAADYWASGDLAGYYSETYGDASQAAAGASWPPPASGIPNNWTPGYPNPVPPPPQPGSYGSFPPPPPPPPSAGGGADTATVAADEWNFGALLAPPAPPPPPS
jgi:splicing factor 1